MVQGPFDSKTDGDKQYATAPESWPLVYNAAQLPMKSAGIYRGPTA